MELKHETSSVILKLMGIDKVPTQHHPVRNRHKVLSEDYLQKVASIGVRKKRSSHQHRCLGASNDEKEGSDDVLKVVKTIKRDKNHNPSKGNGKENLSLFGTTIEGVPQKTNVKAEDGNLMLQQKTNNGLQNHVDGEVGLYEILMLSKSQLDLNDVTFDSRIGFSKVNPGKEGNGKIKTNIRCNTGFGYRFARKVTMTKPVADNCETLTKDDLFQKYWGLSKNSSACWSNQKSEDQNINQKDCSEDINQTSSSEKLPFYSYFNGNDSENFNKLKKRCLTNEDAKNNNHDDNNMSMEIAMSLDSSVDFFVSDENTKVVGCSDNNPTTQQSESTLSVMTDRDSHSLSHASYASKQQETSEFQEDSVNSLCTGADTDSFGNCQVSYEPSPISVLDSTFREDISVISEFGGAGVYDSSEVDDEELDLNVSSDEDCGNESVGDFEEKKDIIGLSTTEESRDFSYVVEVLTEAGISNKSLFKDFSTWHSAECPISPYVFETLEKKFGEQQLWKRSERRLLFDRINLGLLDILHPYLYVPMWETPVSRRMNSEPSEAMIEDEIWGLLVSQEKKAGKETADNMLGGEIKWIELGEDVENIVKEIVNLFIEELVVEIVRLENF